MRLFILLIVSSLFFMACESTVLPKPKGELRLTYPEATYQKTALSCPFALEYSTQAFVQKQKAACAYKIQYPNMKATLYLDYFPVDKNIDLLISNSEKAVYEPHTTQATYIQPQLIQRPQDKVYGTLYELGGRSAVNYQFHLTDSLHHFLRGALYFRVHPNPDSLAPAIAYLKKDVIRLMESLEWKPSKK